MKVTKESHDGVGKLFYQIVERCFELSARYSMLTPVEAKELDCLHNLQRECMTIIAMPY